MSDSIEMKCRLVASFMQFLSEELNSDELNSDSKESIEVAIQCLETAYSINPVDGTLPSKTPILEIFSRYLKNDKHETKKVVSEEDKVKANELKNEGNELMKNGKYQEALEAYTKAIQIDDTNPIYYCNRAAAHSKMENHTSAVEDCKIAIKSDPNYSKAYCRMGLAYVHLKDHLRARDCYKKAFELDPSESTKNNLHLAEQKLQEEQASFGLGGLGNFLQNPQLMNMASQIMSDPNMQNMFSQIMSSAMAGQASTNQANNSEESSNPSDQSTNQDSSTTLPVDALLQMGQQFAERIRAANPELIEQLQNTMSGKKSNDADQNKNQDS